LIRLGQILGEGLQYHGDYKSVVTADEAPTVWAINLANGDVFAAGLDENSTVFDVHEIAAQNKADILEAVTGAIDLYWKPNMESEARNDLAKALWMYAATTSSFAKALPMIRSGQAKASELDVLIIVHQGATKGVGTDFRPAVAFGGISRDPQETAMSITSFANHVLGLDRKGRTGWYGRGLK
jgi:pyruvate dehydrogenase complex dehydrogenase (E1) component